MIFYKEKDTDNVIIFIHIPKTGGTSLNTQITKQYEDYCDIKESIGGPIWNLNSLSRYLKEIKEKKKIKVLRGHFMFGAHKLIPQNKYTYITILRNPVERIISHFYFRRKSMENPRLNKLINQMTLYEFVNRKEFQIKEFPFNFQTRILSGTFEDNLERAKSNLKKYFSVVGITERYEDTLYVLTKEFDWKFHDNIKVNVSKNKPAIKEIPNEIIEIIERNNKKDIELYKFANKLLDKKLLKLKD